MIYKSFVRKRRKRNYKTKFFIAIVFLAIAIFFLDINMRPIINKIATQKAKSTSALLLNKVVSEELSRENIDYSYLVKIEKNKDGKISSIDTNMKNTNTLKSNISNKVQEEFSKISSKKLLIPLGSIIGGYIFDGRGPSVPMKISLCGNIIAKFSSSFTDAGFNQTKHQIYLDVKIEVLSIIPGYPITTGVDTNILVTETVIVGEVPKILANFDNNAQDIIQKLPLAPSVNTP